MAPGDPIQVTLSGATVTLQWSNTTFTCTSSSGSASVTGNPGTGSNDDVTGSLAGLTISGTAGPPGSNRCTTNNSTHTTATVSVGIPSGGLPFTADAQGMAGPDGSVALSGTTITVVRYPVSGSTVTCTYAAALTGGFDNGTSKATFISPMTKTGGPFICGTSGTFNATYLLASNGYTLALH
jgi:hypothetical protein